MWGGADNYGTVFKLDRTGRETVTHTFALTPDGGYPVGGLARDAQGDLLGTTDWGGTYNGGTVFELNTNGVETILYSFCARTGCTDGENPYAGVVLDAKGDVYGTTLFGGGYKTQCETPCGTVFRVSRGSKKIIYTKLLQFTGKADGGHPQAGLVEDAQGNLYGTTSYGSGTVFRLSFVNTQWVETVLYSFTGGVETGPYAGLVLDASGSLYGTTNGGGVYNLGTVFKLDTTGNETVLYSFSGTPDGAFPRSGLVMDAQGNLYGTTVGGGDAGCDSPFGCGTVFKLDVNGNETVLHSFTGGADGSFPYAGLVQDAQGNFYGTTFNGGSNSCSNGSSGTGCGVVFKVTP
jgi:uncharacterized repeat protein (TIGR03803 family)